MHHLWPRGFTLFVSLLRPSFLSLSIFVYPCSAPLHSWSSILIRLKILFAMALNFNIQSQPNIKKYTRLRFNKIEITHNIYGSKFNLFMHQQYKEYVKIFSRPNTNSALEICLYIFLYIFIHNNLLNL